MRSPIACVVEFVLAEGLSKSARHVLSGWEPSAAALLVADASLSPVFRSSGRSFCALP